MKYMGDMPFWNDKFSQRTNSLMSPEEIIVKYSYEFHGNSVLDIACGDGRNTIYFLKKGFNVTSVDFSNVALRRLENFADPFKEKLTIKQVDLSHEKALTYLGTFDNIIVSHYRLSKELLRKVHMSLNDNGLLLITGFSESHHCDDRIGKEELWYQKDIEILLDKFDLITESENSDQRGNFVTYIFRKKMEDKNWI